MYFFFFTIVKTNPENRTCRLCREGSKDCGEGGIGRREPRALSEPVEGCPARNIDLGCDMRDVRPQGSLCQPSEVPAPSPQQIKGGASEMKTKGPPSFGVHKGQRGQQTLETVTQSG